MAQASVTVSHHHTGYLTSILQLLRTVTLMISLVHLKVCRPGLHAAGQWAQVFSVCLQQLFTHVLLARSCHGVF